MGETAALFDLQGEVGEQHKRVFFVLFYKCAQQQRGAAA